MQASSSGNASASCPAALFWPSVNAMRVPEPPAATMPSTTRTGLGHLRSAAVSRSAWAGARAAAPARGDLPAQPGDQRAGPAGDGQQPWAEPRGGSGGKHLVSGQRPHAERTESGPGQPAERAANRAAHGELGEDRAADLTAGGADGAQQREPAPAQVHRQRGGARQHEQGDQHDRDDERPGQTLAVGPLDRGVQVRDVARGPHRSRWCSPGRRAGRRGSGWRGHPGKRRAWRSPRRGLRLRAGRCR